MGISARATKNSHIFFVKFSVFKNFTNAIVFSIKSTNIWYSLILTSLSISDTNRVLTSGIQKFDKGLFICEFQTKIICF